MRYFIFLIGLYRGCGKGITSNRIVSGSEADPYSIPWQAALVRKGEHKPFCGGTIISRRFIMTAAHCMYLNGWDQLIGPDTFQIVAGEHNWWKNGRIGNSRHKQRGDIENIVMHPSYDSQKYPSQDYDYAIIELIKPFKLKGHSKARAACLPDPTTDIDYPDGTKFVVGGWGPLAGRSLGCPYLFFFSMNYYT